MASSSFSDEGASLVGFRRRYLKRKAAVATVVVVGSVVNTASASLSSSLVAISSWEEAVVAENRLSI